MKLQCRQDLLDFHNELLRGTTPPLNDFEMTWVLVKNETSNISSKILLTLSYWHSTDSKECVNGKNARV